MATKLNYAAAELSPLIPHCNVEETYTRPTGVIEMSEPTMSGREVITYFAIAGSLGGLLALGVEMLGSDAIRWRGVIGFAIIAAILFGGLTIADVSKKRDKEAERKPST